jgi:hypothetical protein
MIVTGTVSGAAVALAVKVSVLLVVAELGLKDEVTPLGKVDHTEKLTLPLNPFAGTTVMVLVPRPPGAMVTLDEAESVKDAPDKLPLGAAPPQPPRITARQTAETNSGANFSRSMRGLPFPEMKFTSI